VATLFPELFPGPLGASLAGDALKRGLWSLDTVALRDFGIGRHRQVDDTPAGGGAGMVLRADVVAAALDAARALAPANAPAIYLSPRGESLTQALVRELAAAPGVILLAGRFEGLDQRVIDERGLREVSIGDYVLSGGELAAMVLIDAVVRLRASWSILTTRARASGRGAPSPMSSCRATTNVSPNGAAPRPSA
jgi:tRNA (guanine37-N1)-methyltransferase